MSSDCHWGQYKIAVIRSETGRGVAAGLSPSSEEISPSPIREYLKEVLSE
jgi:hypothetical protein